MNDDRLDTLIAALSDGTITADERDELERVLMSDDEAVARLVDHQALAAELRWKWRAADAPIEAEPPTVAGRVDASPARRANAPALALAAAVVLGACALTVYVIGIGDAGETDRRATHTEPLGVISEVDGVRWTNGPRAEGDELGRGVIGIDGGVATVNLLSGTTVTAQGATRFEIVAADRVALRAGSLFVDAAPGFTVELPGGYEVVDVGTSFDVWVGDDALDVAVTSGAVELHEPGGDAPRRIEAGAAVRLAPAGGEATVYAVEPTPAWSAPAGAEGTQDEFDGGLGVDLIVSEPVRVWRLGVFDSGGDGLRRPIRCVLWSRDDAGTPNEPRDDKAGRVVAELTFDTGADDELIGGFRWRTLARPIVLAPGAYTVVASGYGVEEPNLNVADRIAVAGPALSEPDGASPVRPVGLARFARDPADFPMTVDRGPALRYGAGSIAYQPLTPAPTPADDPAGPGASPKENEE